MSVVPADRVFVIAEAGVTSFGDPQLAHRQVDVAADAGADAVKFQAWRTENLVSRSVAARASDALGDDWFERMRAREHSQETLRELHHHADERGILWFATPHDDESIDFLLELGVPMLKVGSGESSNWRFLERVGAAGLPVLISFGLQSDDDARRAVDTLREAGAPEVAAFHCVSIYPTPAHLAALHRIERLRELLGVPVGISDHSVGTHVALAAVARGAELVEKHLTFDRTDPRSLDNPGALEPDALVAFVREIREVEQALASQGQEAVAAAQATSAEWATQAVVAARDLPPGTVLSESDLAFKRPLAGGIAAADAEIVIGRTLARAVAADEQILQKDLD